jgi:SH3-like domain-containing protein
MLPADDSVTHDRRFLTRIRRTFAAVALLWVCAAQALAADGGSGLALPRFVSLDADEVNLRAGPGLKYPVHWVFVRAALPVEVIDEFDQWRRVRDHDGTIGWVHRSMLSGKRSVIVVGGETNDQPGLYHEPAWTAPLVARAEAGVQGRLLACHDEWCRIELGDYRGWMLRRHLWGVYRDEELE